MDLIATGTSTAARARTDQLQARLREALLTATATATRGRGSGGGSGSGSGSAATVRQLEEMLRGQGVEASLNEIMEAARELERAGEVSDGAIFIYHLCIFYLQIGTRSQYQHLNFRDTLTIYIHRTTS
jgi:nitrogen regulatory protein PII